MKWTTELRPTDIADPMTGEPLYAWAKIRPAWYWFFCRLHLFFAIVWRPYETGRIDIKTAWSVSEVAVGLSE